MDTGISAKKLVTLIRTAGAVMEVYLPCVAVRVDESHEVVPWSGVDIERFTQAQRARLLALNHQIQAILLPQAVDASGVVGGDDAGSHDADSLFVVVLHTGWVVVAQAEGLQIASVLAQVRHPGAVALRVWNLGAALRAAKVKPRVELCREHDEHGVDIEYTDGTSEFVPHGCAQVGP